MLERLLAVTVLAVAGFYLTQALALPLGTVARPGAGFYPSVVALFACVIGLVAAIRAFVIPRAAAGDAAAAIPGGHRRVALVTAALLGFCLAMPWVGYPLAAAAFVMVALRGLGSRWPVAMVTGVLSAAGSHYLFAALLEVPLPRGPW